MNRSETSAILTILKTAYPQFYRGIDVKEAERTVSLWHEMFKDDPVDVVAVAVKAMIVSRTNTFPPNIGEIKEEIAKMRSPNEMTAIEAWGLVAAATRNSLYNAQAEFDKLPPAVQRLVGSPVQLKEWATMDADTVSSVIASNFQRAYRIRSVRDREYMKLPEDIKKVISGVADRLSLGDGALDTEKEKQDEQR